MPSKSKSFLYSSIAAGILGISYFYVAYSRDKNPFMPAAPPHVGAAMAALAKDKSTLLDVTFPNGKKITETGMQLAKADTQEAPTLSKSNLSPNTTYLALCLDLDPPFPAAPFMGPILHWAQSDLKVSPSSSTTLTSSIPPIAPYKGPGPPPISPPHRYVFLLYEQPATMDTEKLRPGHGEGEGGARKQRDMTMWERVRYRLDSFEEKAGLNKEKIVGCNVYVCNK